MSLRVVGAGLGRTGTMSLKLALERLLGAPCYHMLEVFKRPEHIPVWHAAARNEPVDWQSLFAGYAAAVDWPIGSFWPEVSAAFPDAVILLSTRSADSWWKSASETIFPTSARAAGTAWHEMWMELARNRFTPHLDDRAAAVAAYERHNAEVRARAPRARLLEWTARDGWDPLCRALGVAVPDEPFPHANSRAEFLGAHARGAG
jgi:Sulfotransferase domain